MAKWLRSAVLSGFLASQALAADPEAEIRKTFLEPWVQALPSNDPEKLAPFLHPKVLECRTAQSKEYFDYLLTQESRFDPKLGYRVTKLTAIQGPPGDLPTAAAFRLPIQPTYELQLDIGDTALVRYLASSDGSWYEVFPCPNDKGIALTHEVILRRTEQENRTRQLVSEIKAPLLPELQDLIRQQRINDAIQRYRAATGADLTTAHDVIEMMRPPH
jgi:hypothetical protein